MLDCVRLLYLQNKMRRVGTLFGAAVDSVTPKAVRIAPTSVAFGGRRGISAAPKLRLVSAALGLQNAAPLYTAKRWLSSPGGGLLPVFLCLPSWPCLPARKVSALPVVVPHRCTGVSAPGTPTACLTRGTLPAGSYFGRAPRRSCCSHPAACRVCEGGRWAICGLRPSHRHRRHGHAQGQADRDHR